MTFVICVFTGVLLPACKHNAENNENYTYVIVHGAAGGGWSWKTIDKLLTSDSHAVYRPTLTGLGEKVHLANSDTNLTTHIDDIVNLILFEELYDIVLVAHSYGGMVVTGVMDRLPERIHHVIFLDAAVPDDGMSALDIWGPLPSSHKVQDDRVYFSWLDISKPFPRDVPQPLKTLTEPVSFKNTLARQLPATFIAFVSPDQVNEKRASNSSWQRAEARGWTIRTLNSGHNANRSHPMELAELLKTAPKDSNQP